MTASASSICLECGIIQKSGRMSCCGYGGSWFGNCGSARNARFGHTWSEGVWICKTRQSQAAVGQQLQAAKSLNDASNDDVSIDINFHVVMSATHVSVLTPTSILTAMPGTTTASTIESDHKFIAYGVDTSTTDAISPRRTPIMHIESPSINASKDTPINLSVIQPVPLAIAKSISSASIDTTVTTYDHSISGPITAKEYQILLPVLVHINIALIIAE